MLFIVLYLLCRIFFIGEVIFGVVSTGVVIIIGVLIDGVVTIIVVVGNYCSSNY